MLLLRASWFPSFTALLERTLLLRVPCDSKGTIPKIRSAHGRLRQRIMPSWRGRINELGHVGAVEGLGWY